MNKSLRSDSNYNKRVADSIRTLSEKWIEDGWISAPRGSDRVSDRLVFADYVSVWLIEQALFIEKQN